MKVAFLVAKGSRVQVSAAGNLVSVNGRQGIVNWDGRPEHQFLTVRWLDDGIISNVVLAEDVIFEAVLHDGIDGRPPGDG